MATPEARLFCASCKDEMLPTDRAPVERVMIDARGERVPVVEVEYVCGAPNCGTICRLRFRTDGRVGDLAREVMRRTQHAKGR